MTEKVGPLERRRPGLGVLLALAATVGGCGSDGSGGTGSMPPPAPVATNAVDVADNRFSPPQAAITNETGVTWTWRGARGHNVTFEDGQGSSPTRSSGTHLRAFQTTGTFRYRCTIHSTNFESGMIGAVIVN